MIVKFAHVRDTPGKLAEAELHFEDGPLAGMKLVGFAVWEAGKTPTRNVTFPSRQYAVNTEKRSFALLRCITDNAATERVRRWVLDAFATWEAGQ